MELDLRRLPGDTKVSREVTVLVEKLIFSLAVKKFPVFCIHES